jgi:hypothetical protein
MAEPQVSGQLTDREASALAEARRLLAAAEAEMRYGAGCRAAALPMLYDALAAVAALVSATATELERSRARGE